MKRASSACDTVNSTKTEASMSHTENSGECVNCWRIMSVQVEEMGRSRLKDFGKQPKEPQLYLGGRSLHSAAVAISP